MALYDKGWPRAVPKFTGETVATLTMLACSDPPDGAARWTLRPLADRMMELGYVDCISHVTVRELLKIGATQLRFRSTADEPDKPAPPE